MFLLNLPFSWKHVLYRQRKGSIIRMLLPAAGYKDRKPRIKTLFLSHSFTHSHTHTHTYTLTHIGTPTPLYKLSHTHRKTLTKAFVEKGD